ncbi:MAG: hypothetical protein WD738_03220 [Pirellulales bacterium]
MDRIQHATFAGPRDATKVVLTARQLLHARLGLPLVAAGCWILVAAMVQYLELERGLALGVIAGGGALAFAAIALGEWRARKQGLWARAGNPSLAAPADWPGLDPTTKARLQFGALLVLGALIVGAYLFGVTIETALFWIMAYGFVHMAIYTVSLAFNLAMPEQLLALAWFVCGGLFWLATGHAIAFVFGGGWLLMGLLLYARLRQFEKLASSRASSDQFEEDAP